MNPGESSFWDSGDEPDAELGSRMTEAEYLRELARSQRPVVIYLRSGEAVRGVIEYFDQRFIRLTRQGEPNLFIFKHEIKYFHEDRT
jgi:host factor-I protein